jgi:hypothetical protein
VGVAELDDEGAPNAVRALWSVLPIEGELLVSMWSGHAGELALPPALAMLAGREQASIDIPVGALALGAGADGPVLLIAYGPSKFHTAAGPALATLVGRLVENGPAVLEQIERTFDVGAVPVAISAVE